MNRITRLLIVFAVCLVLTVSVFGWANWHREALPETTTATRLIIDKSARTLRLFDGDEAIKTYRVSFGESPIGHKRQEGDERTPEGTYHIDLRNEHSSFHRALRISYPNAQDRAHADSLGVSPGGQIMIHGMRNGLGWIGKLHQIADWTDGCIAVTDDEMDELWRAVPVGTQIEILP